MGEQSIQHQEELGLYMQETGSVRGERRLFGNVLYRQGDKILQGALMELIKESIVLGQEDQVSLRNNSRFSH